MMTISCHFSRERLGIQCTASTVASRDTLVRNETIVTTIASNVSRERLGTVYTTDHAVCIRLASRDRDGCVAIMGDGLLLELWLQISALIYNFTCEIAMFP